MQLVAHLPKIDFEEFRADIDEHIDQTPYDPYERFGKNDDA
jgi:hypothetical protein